MNKIYKSLIGVSAAAVLAAATITPVIVNAWGDNANGRATYTIAEINDGKLGDTITFNSITDGAIGDERNFVGAKLSSDVSNKSKTWNANEIDVKDGETYTIRLYVHNNSPKGMERIAENVKATFSLPTTVAKSHTVIGYLDSSNATPTRYWDEVTLKSNDNFYLEYVDGSAKYSNGKMGTVSLPNDVIISGATLGYDKLDGKIPGCYEYDGEVTIQVKVHTSVSAKLSKKVRIKGTKTWSESVEANVGDEVEYQIEYVNLLADTVKDVMIRDILPNNVEYVKDSTYLYNSIYQNGTKLSSNNLTTTGINIGDHAAKANSYIRFTGKVVDNSLACGKNQLVNWANSTVNGSVTKDDASVMVTKTCDTPDEPGEDPIPDNPSNDTPSTIVSTGAGTIATGAVGVGSVVTMLGYYIASRKKLM